MPDFARFLLQHFPKKSIHEQEAMIIGYVDLLIQKLSGIINKDSSETTAVVDLLQWFNYITFDIIGDFVWSSSFHCLGQAHPHPYIQVIAQFKVALIAGSLKFYPPLDSILTFITPKSAMADLCMIWETTEDKISQRFTVSQNRRDVMSYMIDAEKSSHDHYMSRDEIEINSMLLVVGRSESVTTTLVGAIHWLTRTPFAFEELVQEIRTTYQSEEDIAGVSLSRLSYLNAVIHETLRLCPTIPDGMRRQIPEGGASVAGHFLPGGTVVSIPQWAANQSSENFHRPQSFLPERWLEGSTSKSSAFKTDRKDAFNPFSLGSHNWPGRALAYLEVRLILAKILWHFDIALPKSKNLMKWEDQAIWWFWDKQPLKVKIAFRSGA